MTEVKVVRRQNLGASFVGAVPIPTDPALSPYSVKILVWEGEGSRSGEKGSLE